MIGLRPTRREILEFAAVTSGIAVLLPSSVGCAKNEAGPAVAAAVDPLTVPLTPPPDWDAIAFNRARGNAGAIPESYRAKINGPDGVEKHLGKHLPYVASLPSVALPEGMLAVMWGDPSRGFARHPNARPSEELPSGHWFNWIRVRRAVADAAEEHESRYSDWPATSPTDTGVYRAFAGTDPSADEGRNTVYLAALPSDARPGDLVRVHGHCLTHGEYVDFVRVPA
jgi:hypothetical protein